MKAAEFPNDLTQAAIREADLSRENIRLRAALETMLGDRTMAECLWGGLPDDATMTITVKLGTYRAAQKAMRPYQQSTPIEK